MGRMFPATVLFLFLHCIPALVGSAIRPDATTTAWPPSRAANSLELIAYRNDNGWYSSIRVGEAIIRADLSFAHPHVWLPMYGCVFESEEYEDICRNRAETYSMRDRQRPIDRAEVFGTHSYILGFNWSAQMRFPVNRRSGESASLKMPFIVATVLHEVQRGGIGLSPQSVFAAQTLKWLRNNAVEPRAQLGAPFFAVAQLPGVLGVTFDSAYEDLCKLPKNPQNQVFLDLDEQRSRHWVVGIRELRVWNLRMQGNMRALIDFDSPYLTIPASLIDVIRINNPEKVHVDDQGRVFVRRDVEISLGISTKDWEFTLDEGTFRRGPMGNEKFEELLIRRGDLDSATIGLGGPFAESFCVLLEMPHVDPRGSPWTDALPRVGILERRSGGGTIGPAKRDGCGKANKLTSNNATIPCSKDRVIII